ncbi:bifunctional adenosylcobinamide kinase/adenosylcobinamide-phosphate guanylyltransferase [Desulfofundulus thermocisternus]|uniref:bifunctional adenosylcobinamide kinase/adenosylcobinamide-phosphate guanylyltransferase n=1 Tax=Desulfofundulus thermocisternus TaxID=42471 RepID=UPI00217CCC02|nr:bifunctional adenosylcobinamide kinase/adenosylcobinamide-phosphate guanylyltransferase [Desulfofundulus thermocisternus]MCS5695761.1 bifunctional adenosylcobinamide kinase/adenosylcobinamide-phosphate guanylyltransferase [Desulfofundulus thermocisternus]
MALVFVIGGARSGKSSFAEELAASCGSRVVYVATASALDEEMARRIHIHRVRRPASWVTVEETRCLEKVIRQYENDADALLIDCVTMWLTNLLLDENLPCSGGALDDRESYILEEARRLAGTAVASPARVIMVANEVGLGLVPDNALGRAFRDLAGRVNQLLAREAEEVYLVVAGLPVEIKPRVFKGRRFKGRR